MNMEQKGRREKQIENDAKARKVISEKYIGSAKTSRRRLVEAVEIIDDAVEDVVIVMNDEQRSESKSAPDRHPRSSHDILECRGDREPTQNASKEASKQTTARFKPKKKFRSKLQRLKQQSLPQPTRLECSFLHCKSVFVSMRGLVEHMKKAHTIPASFQTETTPRKTKDGKREQSNNQEQNKKDNEKEESEKEESEPEARDKAGEKAMTPFQRLRLQIKKKAQEENSLLRRLARNQQNARSKRRQPKMGAESLLKPTTMEKKARNSDVVKTERDRVHSVSKRMEITIVPALNSTKCEIRPSVEQPLETSPDDYPDTCIREGVYLEPNLFSNYVPMQLPESVTVHAMETKLVTVKPEVTSSTTSQSGKPSSKKIKGTKTVHTPRKGEEVDDSVRPSPRQRSKNKRWKSKKRVYRSASSKRLQPSIPARWSTDTEESSGDDDGIDTRSNSTYSHASDEDAKERRRKMRGKVNRK